MVNLPSRTRGRRTWGLPDTASVGAGAFGDQDELLALAEEAARIGIWDIELETGLLRARPQFFRIMGLEPTDQPIPIETTRRLRHPQDRERVLLAMQDAAAGGKDGYQVEYRIIRPDGVVRWIFGRGRFVRDASGMVVRSSGVDVDISK